MKRLILALAVVAAGCQNSASDEAFIARARQEAEMPDCRSIRVGWVLQRRQSDGYQIVVEFAGSRSCMEEWGDRIAHSPKFETYTDGGAVPKDKARSDIFGVFPSHDGGIVIWKRNAPMPGLQVRGTLND